MNGNQLHAGVETVSEYRAILLSRSLTSTENQQKCLSFWYHMSGQGEESCVLRVKVSKESSTDIGTTLWAENAKSQQEWKRASINIDAATPYQVGN